MRDSRSRGVAVLWLREIGAVIRMQQQGARPEDAVMTFTIYAARADGRTQQTLRISPTTAVEKAQALLQLDWDVYITDSIGHRYQPDAFDALSRSRETYLS